MSQNSESSCPQRETVLRIESLPFSEIPHQSRLFIDFQTIPEKLKKMYPQIVENFDDIAAFAPVVLKNYSVDRDVLCDALETDNRSFAAGGQTLENIRLLRENDCLTVVTGQQAGLLTGAIYTIYKAFSAIKAVERLKAKGIKAVPVFWIAEEDHDFDEVKKTFVADNAGQLQSIENTPHTYLDDLPVGRVNFDETIEEMLVNLSDHLPVNEFSGELENSLRAAYRQDETFSTSFAKFLSILFKDYGLIIFSPLNPAFKKLAAPIFLSAVEKSVEIREHLLNRNDELKAEKYQAQVLVEKDFFPFFLMDQAGKRRSIKFNHENSTFKIKNGQEIELAELKKIAADAPENLSPNALLRPVVQDFLLPTIGYFGGAAEIAYFAQNSVIYEVLKRPPTTILHRQSLTFIESKHRRTLEKYQLKLTDLFGGFERVLPQIVSRFLNPELAGKFSATRELFAASLSELETELAKVEPTLAAHLRKRESKILYHIDALERKFQHAQIRHNEIVNRQIESALTMLLPHHALQERTLNITSFLSRYGFYFIDWIGEAIDLDDKAHRVIYL